MKTYHCSCGQLVFFENTSCVNCGRELGFLPDLLALSDLDRGGEGEASAYMANEAATRREYKKCANYERERVCNWMVPAEGASEPLCISCRLNEVIPDLSVAGNREQWASIEGAKRRLVYSLLWLGLPVENKTQDPERGLAFRFLADTTAPDGAVQKVLTGHDHGTITLNLDEANDSVRERMRHSMNEPYRTLLGHFRHESGHYYWERLVAGTDFAARFRDLFGDESVDYGEALKNHYANGARADWQNNFISAYAAAHPWEDWAETWAHFLHFQDTMEVAVDFGLVGKKWRLEKLPEPSVAAAPNPGVAVGAAAGVVAGVAAVPKANAFDGFVRAWSELTIALNSINRAMGLHDLYPFVLTQPVIQKLRFVAEVIAAAPAAKEKMDAQAIAGAGASNGAKRETLAARA